MREIAVQVGEIPLSGTFAVIGVCAGTKSDVRGLPPIAAVVSGVVMWQCKIGDLVVLHTCIGEGGAEQAVHVVECVIVRVTDFASRAHII